MNLRWPTVSGQITSEDCGTFDAPRPECRSCVERYGLEEARRRAPRRHRGIDLRAAVGDPVLAVAAGRVSFCGYQGDGNISAPAHIARDVAAAPHGGIGAGGIMVFVDHGSVEHHRVVSQYMHLSDFVVHEGQRVAAGERIASAGDSGDARGQPHLHFQLKLDGLVVDPLPFMPAAGGPVASGAGRALAIGLLGFLLTRMVLG